MKNVRHSVLALWLSTSGCYAAMGPTIGVTTDGRATAGLEGSAATITAAHSFALSNSTPTDAKTDAKEPLWDERTYLAWEPWVGQMFGEANERFWFAGMGPTVGMRWDQLPGGSIDYAFAGGWWISGGSTLRERTPTASCGSEDWRPYAVLVLGIRGDEVYFSPKLGVMNVPRFCFSLKL